MIAANSASSSSWEVESGTDVGVARPHRPADVDTAAVGKPGVQHGDVGPDWRA